MIRKTQKLFRRHVDTWRDGSKDKHFERVCRETWWLLGFIPLYSRDTVVAHNL